MKKIILILVMVSFQGCITPPENCRNHGYVEGTADFDYCVSRHYVVKNWKR